MEYFPIILISFVLLVLITRPFTVLFHELGHAIPAIVLTQQSVAIYIGSYGDPNNSLHFTIGLLEVWFRYNPFSWRLGLCVPSAKEISINKQIVYTLTGPLTSFIIAAIACYFTFSFNLHGSLKLILIIFLGSSIFDLLANLTPRTEAIELYDGRVTYNDGYQLKRLLYFKKLPKEYKQASELYSKQKFAEAAISFIHILKNGWRDENIYRLAISSLLQIRNYIQAKELSDEFMIQGKMNSDDYGNAGISYSQLDLHNKALELYDKSLELDLRNKYSLNNKGFTLLILDKFEESIPLFDKAIEIDKGGSKNSMKV